MIPMTLAQIAALTGGRLSDPGAADVLVDGPVVTDSREAGPGSLYVARIGEHADGHLYTPDAVARGAVAALVTAPVEQTPSVPVSYTHLDVYKRQIEIRAAGEGRRAHGGHECQAEGQRMPVRRSRACDALSHGMSSW